MTPQELLTQATDLIRGTVAANPDNRIPQTGTAPIFDDPLTGVADGRDPLFSEYKSVIGDFHQTPEEILLRRAWADGIAPGSPIRVLCWVLPFSREIKASNRKKEVWPSIHWAYGTRLGEDMVNNRVRRALESFFAGLGFAAAAPVLDSGWRRIENLPGGHTSTWSERHALFAAGMGTFSLNDGFITEKGMAMRCGSVVVSADLPVTTRTARTHTANCLFFSQGGCGKCMERCPAYAITTRGHDKVVCRTYRERLFDRFLRKTCGVDLEVGECGLCQTGVPCESCNPSAADGR